MKIDIRHKLRVIPGIIYEYNDSGTVVRYHGVDLFKLDNSDGGISIVYVENLRRLNPEYENKLIDILKCYLGWD